VADILKVVQLRASRIAALAALVLAAPAPAALASSGSHAPSAQQIRAAVRSAAQSRLLWATVNICNTTRHRDTIGIRGQAPSLPFATTISMRIQVDYWNGSKFVPDRYATKRVNIGDPVNEVVQNGANFTFHPPEILSGTIEFEWKLGGRVIGRATRLTGHGYKHVAGGDPSGYSTATCRIS
jgi:hypothetical protein